MYLAIAASACAYSTSVSWCSRRQFLGLYDSADAPVSQYRHFLDEYLLLTVCVCASCNSMRKIVLACQLV